MATNKPDYLPPMVETKVYEAPPANVNWERLHAKAVERINELETELAAYKADAKVVSVVASPLGFVAVDDHGNIFELVNDPTPRGPGPQAKMWVHRPGPKRP